MSKTIIDILDVLYHKKKMGHSFDKSVDQALKEIETLILECLPEELDLSEQEEKSKRMFVRGYNQALSDTKANLLKVLK